MARFQRRRLRPQTTRDKILQHLRAAMVDSVTAGAAPSSLRSCTCDDCRIARAADISENPVRFQITPAQWNAVQQHADRLGWDQTTLIEFSQEMFDRPPALLREVEAGALIAHLERLEHGAYCDSH